MSLQSKALGEVVEPIIEQGGPASAEFTYIDIGSIDRETKRIIDPKVLPKSKAPSRAKQRLRAGDVLVSMTRPNLNAVALVPPEYNGAIGSTGFHVLRARDALPGYLFYAVQTSDFVDAMCRKVQGALYPAVRPRDISSYTIGLPDKTEQRRIVAEIEKQFTRLDAGVTALRRVQANLKRYRAAVLKAACEGRLVPTDLSTWQHASLGNVLVGIEAGKSFRCEERPPRKEETGVMKVSAVTWGEYDEQESKTCLDPDRIEERYLVTPGDFLFSRANTIELIGACVIAQKVSLRVMLSDKILRFRFHPETNPKWVLYWLRSEFGRHEIERLSTGNQESMRNIGQERIRQIAIKLPAPAEQKRIVAEVERRLSVIDELETVVTANLARATRLRQSVLQQAFTANS